ncbi:Pancreatic lipase-related protein 2 [Halotydeus destructor]|nr:Pancreatic lipase-related protein 2 [Halotydeus destructor]
MIPLVHDSRLLGFISANDEPIRHLNVFPEDPDLLGTQFYIVDLDKVPKQIGFADNTAIQALAEEGYDKVYFVIHSIGEMFLKQEYKEMVNELLDHEGDEAGNPAIVLVGWKNAAKYNDSAMKDRDGQLVSGRSQAHVNAMVTGRQLAVLTYLMTKHEVIEPSMVHYIGFGLGAQVAHFAGQYFKVLADLDVVGVGGPRSRVRVGRITGLDPTAMDFQGYKDEDKLAYLNADDADFVDIIHTSAVIPTEDMQANMEQGRYGMSVASGHIDFYPNGGQRQPFCSISDCSHKRALRYFKESLSDDEGSIGSLTASHADSYREFLSAYESRKDELTSGIQNTMGISATKPENGDREQNSFFILYALNDDDQYVEPEGWGRSSNRYPLTFVDTFLNDTEEEYESGDEYDFTRYPSQDPSSIPVENIHVKDIKGCGRFLEPPTGDGRVHFGLRPYVRQFPWTVCIVRSDFHGGAKQSCTGSLLTDEFVVTAAHCFGKLRHKSYPTRVKIRDAKNHQLFLIFGSADCKRPAFWREVVLKQDITVFIHPKYDPSSSSKKNSPDIAIIKLPKPIEPKYLPIDGVFTEQTLVNTICWRKAITFDYLEEGRCQQLYFSGFGINQPETDEEEKVASALLLWTVLKIIKYPAKLAKNIFVAENSEYHKLRNTCPGDSGGPYMRYVRNVDGVNQTYSQVSPYTANLLGTNRAGRDGHCGIVGKVSLATKVGFDGVYNWIERILSEHNRYVTEPIPDYTGGDGVDIEEYFADD